MTSLADRIRAALASAGDPARAVQQQRYMKSALPFRGLTHAELRALLKPVLAAHQPDDSAQWEATIRDLWDHATHREEWYAALAVARHRTARPWREHPSSLGLYEHLVRHGAWWDVVDETAAHLVGGLLTAHRADFTPVMRAWSVDDDLWIRRTAILSQLRHRDSTDTGLLADCLDANLEGSLHGSQFFVRKAVGWSLREYARTDPEWVRAYVEQQADRMSGLSRREALKHLSQTGTSSSAPTR